MLVEGRVGDLGGDELLEFGQLGVGLWRNVLRGIVENAELIFVALQRLQPAIVTIEPQVAERRRTLVRTPDFTMSSMRRW